MRKQINGYNNYYIYDNGDVLNISTNKILKGSIGENGYKYYRLSKDNQYVQRNLRFIAESESSIRKQEDRYKGKVEYRLHLRGL